MRCEHDDPLPFDLWLSELGKLAEASARFPAADQDRAVRRAFHLFMLAPPSIRALGDPALDETAMELLLDRGEAEQAAHLIAGERVSVSSERRGDRRHVAILSFADTFSGRGEGASPALAMVGAWADLFSTVPRRELVRRSATR